MKTNKSLTKRIKITNGGKLKKGGKLLTRKPGGNHFNMKEGSKKKTERRKGNTLKMSQRARRRFLPNA